MFHPALQKNWIVHLGNVFFSTVAIPHLFPILCRRSWEAVVLYSILWILHWTTMSAEYPTLCMKPLTALTAAQHLCRIPSDALVSPVLSSIFFSSPVQKDWTTVDGKCVWLAYLMLIGLFFFFQLNRSTQLLSELYRLASLKHHYLQTCFPFIFLPILFHHWNLSGISVIPNSASLHSTSCSLQSGQFLFYQSHDQWLGSCLFGYIRIGNLILRQSFLSSPHRQTFHICIQTEGGMIAFIQGCLNMHRWTCSGSVVSLFFGRSGGT